MSTGIRRFRHRLFRISIAAGLLFGLVAAPTPLNGAADGKTPVPNDAALAAATKTVGDLFKSDYTAAKTPAQKTALAKKMIKAGIDTRDDHAGRYTLFRVGGDIAAAAGDIETSFAAIDEMARSFAVDGPALKAEALKKAASAARTADDARKALAAVDSIIEQALAADEIESASSLAALATGLARKAGDAESVKKAAARKTEIDAIAQQFAAVKPALEALAKNPVDAEANLTLGRFRAFVQGDWEHGVPLLALGSDAALKEIAAAELQGPSTADDQLKLADRWYDYGETTGGIAKKQLQRHAAELYRLAQPQLTGIKRAKADQRLTALKDVLAGATPKRRDFPVGEVKRLAGYKGSAFVAVFSADGRRIAGGGEDGKVYVWDTHSGELHRTLEGHSGWVRALSFSPTGDRLASGGDDKTVRIWDLAAGRELHRCEGHGGGIQQVRFVEPAARHVVSAGGDRTVRLWDSTSGKESSKFSFDTGNDAYAKDISANGAVMLTGGIDDTGRFWDVGAGKSVAFRPGHTYSGALSSTGRIAATGGGDNSVQFWDVSTQKKIGRGDNPAHTRSMRLSNDGRRVLVGCSNNMAVLVDTQSGRIVYEMRGNNGEVHFVDLSRDGRLALTTGGSTIILWRVPD